MLRPTAELFKSSRSAIPTGDPRKVAGATVSSSYHDGADHVNGLVPMVVPAVDDTATVIIRLIGGASRCGVCGG